MSELFGDDDFARELDAVVRRPDKFRLDGSPYPPGDEGLFEWMMDFGDDRGRIVAQDYLWNGIWVSTIWIGLAPHRGAGPPKIFESMAWNHVTDGRSVWAERWETLDDATVGHLYLKHHLGSLRFTLGLWWKLIWEEVTREDV